MGFLDLFVVALIPVLKTLLVTATGLVLALERVNILGHTARHNLNNLVFFVFNPAFVASSLADTITLSSLIQLWFMPVNVLLTFIIGSTLGWILVKITRTPQHLHGLVICCCSAGNFGNLPIIVLPAVCKETNSPFGDSSTCSTKARAYASLSMAIGTIFIWSYAYNIIRAGAVRNVDSKTSIHFSGQCSAMLPESDVEEALLSKDSAVYNNEIHQVQDALFLTYSTEDNNKVPFLKKFKLQLKIWTAKLNLKELLSPSTIATIVGLVLGVVYPLKKLIVGDTAPFRVIDTSASMLGEAAIPAMTLILGANLLKGLKQSGVGLWIIIGVQVVRYIAMPLLGICVVKGAIHVGLVGSDSLYQFVLLLQHALPSAMAIGTMTQLFGIGESDCSAILLWNYAVASLTFTLWSAYYMWLVS